MSVDAVVTWAVVVLWYYSNTSKLDQGLRVEMTTLLGEFSKVSPDGDVA